MRRNHWQGLQTLLWERKNEKNVDSFINHNKGIKEIELPKGYITIDVELNSSITPTGEKVQDIKK